MKRSDGESERQYIWRLATAMEDGRLDMNWTLLTDVLNRELHDDAPLAESTYRKAYQAARSYYDEVFLPMMAGRDVTDTVQERIRLMQKEQMKLQTEKLEYSRWLRENSRDELIVERLIDAISMLSPIQAPDPIIAVPGEIGYLCAFGDEHYGAEFEILGLHGEVINAYSPEIFKQRMSELLAQLRRIIAKEDIRVLHLFNMGDFTDGAIRVGQLMKLRYGVVDGTVQYMEYLAWWINQLTQDVKVKFQMANGNHSELRLFNQPKGAFKDENMGKVVAAYLKARLADNPNFEYIENPSGLIFTDIAGFNVLGIHGEVKNMERAIRDFSAIYKTRIDFLLAGHLHHAAGENVGISQDVIRVPSIVGVDDYSMSLMKASNPGATLVSIERGVGKVMEYSLKL